MYLGFAGDDYYPDGGAFDCCDRGRNLAAVKQAVEVKYRKRVWVREAKPAYTWTDEMDAMSTSNRNLVGTVVAATRASADSAMWGHVLRVRDGAITQLSLVNDGDGAWHFEWSDWEPA